MNTTPIIDAQALIGRSDLVGASAGKSVALLLIAATAALPNSERPVRQS